MARTNDELKELARDIKRGIVFTDRHIPRNETEMTGSIFMPLALMSEEQMDKMRENPPGMIYEYMSEAGPMSVNGFPIFFSFHQISQEDSEKVWEYYDKLEEMERQFMEDEDNE